MRKIKFRVRDLKENKWVSPNILIDYSGLLFWSFGGEVELIDDKDRYDVQFYTGLKDKNGKEIYEGDIVEIEYLHYPESDKEKLIAKYISTIIFQGGCFVFYDGYEYHVPCQACFKTRIIGNIYENPELLGEKWEEKLKI